MPVKIAERFAKTCQVVFHTNYDTCGTITRTDIEYMTPATLEALFAPGGMFADLQAWFKTAFELKACGTKINGMYDWIMANADKGGMKGGITKQNVAKNPAVMFPFILGLQESVINTEYWYIDAGFAVSGYVSGSTNPATGGPLTPDQLTGNIAVTPPVGANDRVIRLKSRQANVTMDAKWVVERDRIFILGRSGIGVAQRGQWQVASSATATDGSFVDVVLRSENAGSSQPYNAAPTNGLVLLGVNNVNDYEKWCHNRANYDGTKEVPFWWQTMRRTRCVDQLYREYYARLMTEGVNEAFKRFGDMPLAKRNAQDEADYQKRFVNAFFFQKAISQFQTMALWKSLDDIKTPLGMDPLDTQGVQVITKRANFIGVVEQLRECDRYRDAQGLRLNFYEWLDVNYQLLRSRESNGKTVNSIDWYTDEITAANFITAYTNYLKAEYGTNNVQFPIDIQKPISNRLGFAWRTLQVKFPTVPINIVTHKFWNDLRDAYKAEGMESAGLNLWALDWGDKGIFWAQIASNRKTWRVGDLSDLAPIDKDWACVMETLTSEVTHHSESGTVVVQCPNDSLIIQNFMDAVPDTGGKSAAGGGSYSDLITY